MTPDRRLLTSSFDRMPGLLATEIARLKGARPLAPVHVLAGSNLLSTWLSRRLAAEGHGFANVRMATFKDLALRAAGPDLPNRPWLPPLVATVLAGRALAGDGRQAGRGTSLAAKQTFDRLRNGGVIPSPARLGDERADRVLAGYERYAQDISRNFVDSGSLFRLAARRAADIGEPLIVYGVYDANALQFELVRRWAEGAPVVWLFPRDGARPASQRMIERLESAGFVRQPSDAPRGSGRMLDLVRARWPEPPVAVPERDPADQSVTIVAASDDLGETVEAARLATDFVERTGAPWHRIAITSRSRETLALMAETLERCGIPYFARGVVPLRSRPAGIGFRFLLDLVDGRRTRTAMFDFINHCDVRDADAVYWADIARRAGIAAGGRSQWAAHFAAYRDNLTERKRKYPESERFVELEIQRLDEAGEFVDRILTLLDSFPEHGRPSHFVERTTELARQLPDSQELGYLLGSLTAITGLDDHVGEIDRLAFVELARETIDALFENSPGRFEDGSLVLLAPEDLRGLRFDLVIVLGLYERGFPTTGRTDPLLDDDAVEAINRRLGVAIERQRDRRQLEELVFLDMLDAAEQRVVLSYPRTSDADDRARLPSHYVQRVAELVVGRPMTAEEVDSAPVTLVSDARTPTVDLYLSAAEYDLGQLEQARMLNAPIPSYLSATEGGASFGRFLDQQRDRWSMRFGEHDGVVGTGEDLLTRLRERRISPTAIEDFSVCPYRVFASRLLGLDKIDEPEELEEISPLESGSLVHGILEDAIAGWQEARLAPGWIEANLDRIADARFRDAEERGVTGLEGMWRRTRVALMRDLRRYLREQLASGLGTAWRPVMPEAGFGMSDGEWPAIEVGGAEKLPMRGKIDRVDLSADGTQVRVIDYKTGRAKSAKLEHGKAFQLPVYLLAALENLGTTEGMAEYHFMTRRGQFKVERFDSDQLREQRGEIEQTIDLVVDHAREGLFPPWPADGKNCRFCNFNRVCGDQLSRRVSRKWEADGRLARYRFIHHGEDGGDDLGAPPSDGDES